VAAPGETVFLGVARGRGQLLLEVEPKGSIVEVDGRRVDVPESGLLLPFGVHSLRLGKEGHEDAACHIELRAAHPHVHLSARLPPRPTERAGGSPSDVESRDDIVPPRRILGALPEVPKGQATRGSAVLDVYLGEAGEVLRVEEVEGDPRLTRALEEAVKTWRFRPAERGGVAVATRLRVHHVFVP
jgi:TonB family protein